MNESQTYTLHPLAGLIMLIVFITLAIICWQVCEHKDLQMRGKRKRGNEYSSGVNANIISEQSPWVVGLWLSIVL